MTSPPQKKLRNIDLFVMLDGPNIYFYKISHVCILFQGTRSAVSQTYVKKSLVLFSDYTARVLTVKGQYEVIYADWLKTSMR
jgi:hypothetical protein